MLPALSALPLLNRGFDGLWQVAFQAKASAAFTIKAERVSPRSLAALSIRAIIRRAIQLIKSVIDFPFVKRHVLGGELRAEGRRGRKGQCLDLQLNDDICYEQLA